MFTLITSCTPSCDCTAAAHELKQYHNFIEGFAELMPHMEAMKLDCEEWYKVCCIPQPCMSPILSDTDVLVFYLT